MLSDFPAFPILLSKDLDATRDFYHGLLGLPILREDPDDRIVFGSAGGRVVVTLSTTGTCTRKPRWPGSCRISAPPLQNSARVA